MGGGGFERFLETPTSETTSLLLSPRDATSGVTMRPSDLHTSRQPTLQSQVIHFLDLSPPFLPTSHNATQRPAGLALLIFTLPYISRL